MPKIEECLNCKNSATWVRSTQFAGDHYFCSKHAKKENDFKDSDSYCYWYKVKKVKL